MWISNGKIRIAVAILAVAVVAGVVGLLVGRSMQGKASPGDGPSEADVLSLASPALAQGTDNTFLNREAGISLYFNAARALDMSTAKGVYRGDPEIETSTYVVGSIALPGLPESDYVHCYVQKDGWIVVYYLKAEQTSKIIDWNLYSGGQLTSNKLKAGMQKMCDSLVLNPTDAKYYHWQYPDANRWMIITETQSGRGTDSFNLNIPSTFNVYQRSWSHRAGTGTVTKCGSLSETQLAPDVSHLVSAQGYEDFQSTISYLNIDSVAIDATLYSKTSEVAIALIYRET